MLFANSHSSAVPLNYLPTNCFWERSSSANFRCPVHSLLQKEGLQNAWVRFFKVEIVWFFGKETKNFIFSIFFPKGGPFGVETVKMVFFNFSKFHNFFSQNSFTGTKQILKQTKSWILVTPVIKLWKCHSILGCSGPKGPPSVGIGLKLKVTKEQLIISNHVELADWYIRGGGTRSPPPQTG